MGLFNCFGCLHQDIYASTHALTREVGLVSGTIRKLRQNIGKESGYFLLPPLNWLQEVEKAQGKKIQGFNFKSSGETLILSPIFEAPKASTSKQGLADDVLFMLKRGVLEVKLREIPKGRNVYRVVKVPRAWVHAQEMQRNRKMAALNVKTEQQCLMTTPIFGDKLKLTDI